MHAMHTTFKSDCDEGGFTRIIKIYIYNKMNHFVNQRVIYAVLFYILLIMLIIISKPSVLFTDEGGIKPFGIGEDKTMFSLGVFTVVLAILSFYIFCLIDLIFGNR